MLLEIAWWVVEGTVAGRDSREKVTSATGIITIVSLFVGVGAIATVAVVVTAFIMELWEAVRRRLRGDAQTERLP